MPYVFVFFKNIGYFPNCWVDIRKSDPFFYYSFLVVVFVCFEYSFSFDLLDYVSIHSSWLFVQFLLFFTFCKWQFMYSL